MSERGGDRPERPGRNSPEARAFRAERAAQVRRGVAIKRDTADEITRLLKLADTQIRAELAGQPSDYKQWYLPRIRQAVQQHLGAAGEGSEKAILAGAKEAHQAGAELIDKPLLAGGIRVTANLPQIDGQQLGAMRLFMTDRIKDITTETVNRANTQLGLVVIGAQAPNDAVKAISASIEGGRSRVVNIVRTELGTVYAAASQARQEQAAAVLPELQKQWRRSGRRRSRPSHDLADGQVKPVNEPFEVGGAKLMFPRDPAAPAKHRVNCGCTSLPYLRDWEVKHPNEQPFGKGEIADQNRRNVEVLRRAEKVDFIAKTLAAPGRPQGRSITLGQYPEAIAAKLALRGITPPGRDILLSDRAISHMVRDKKSVPLPQKLLRDLPYLMPEPMAVLLDRKEPGVLIFVLPVKGDRRLAKLVVKLGRAESNLRHRRGNHVASGGLVSRNDLADLNAYELLSGKLK